MQATEVTPAKEGVAAVMRYTAVAAGEVEVHLFWGMAGSPVVLPPMEVATPAAKPEREKWEANPWKMIAVGGMPAAKAYSDKAVASRKDRPSGARRRRKRNRGARLAQAMLVAGAVQGHAGDRWLRQGHVRAASRRPSDAGAPVFVVLARRGPPHRTLP